MTDSAAPDGDTLSDVPDHAPDGDAASGRDLAVPSPGQSVLNEIEARTGTRPSVSLPDADSAGGTPLPEPPTPGGGEQAGPGKYRVLGILGRGGVGTVHRGRDTDLGRDVALKFLHDRYRDQPTVLHRFVEEAQIGGQLQHPGIVPVYELGMAGGRPFFAMKMVRGETLAQNHMAENHGATVRGAARTPRG